VTDEWKFILPVGASQPELFQIRTDPAEQKSVSGRNPDLVKQLTAKLDAWWSP
jgi:uncharacterized sulfatase